MKTDCIPSRLEGLVKFNPVNHISGKISILSYSKEAICSHTPYHENVVIVGFNFSVCFQR